jgi:TPR repeat protein
MPHNCPACGSAHTRDARLYASDSLLRKLFYSPRRCRSCRHRFWHRNVGKQLGLVGVLGVAVALSLFLADASNAPPPVERVSAVDKLELRARNGEPEAQFLLGMRNLEGDGVPVNLTEANRLFERAAREGNVAAQYEYGQSLLRGRGLVQDFKSALRWIEEPAKRGYAKAQVKLAEMYRYGNGVPQSKARAYLWFNLAAAQGDELAARSRDHMAAQIKPAEIEAMQKAAQKMREGMDAAEAEAEAERQAKSTSPTSPASAGAQASQPGADPAETATAKPATPDPRLP